MSDILRVSFIVSLLSGMLRMAVPILYASIGELITERSGVLNLGIEGMMGMGALAGFLVTYQTGSLWMGVLWAALAGAGLSALFAFVVVVLKADQTISGLTVNIFSAGLSLYLFRITFVGVATQNLPTVTTFETVAIPLLSSIPYIGEALFKQHVLMYIAVIIVVLVHLFLYKTKYGLSLRAIGDNPHAVDMKGVNVTLFKFLGVVFGGMMAGLGGSFLSLASAGLYAPGIIAGRGWIALAIVILGNWKPVNIFFATLLFGLIDTFQLQVQGIGVNLPYQILVALPYVLTIVVLVYGRAKSGVPLALGDPYFREG
jgi:general nucleoside transport system permease protein